MKLEIIMHKNATKLKYVRKVSFGISELMNSFALRSVSGLEAVG